MTGPVEGGRGEGPVLVSGATGFVGSAVTRALLQRGYEVRALVEPGVDPANLAGLDVHSAEADIRDPRAVARAVAGCRAVFHVAALYKFWAPDPRSFYRVNVDGTRNLMAAAAEAGVARVVYTSTVGTLGLSHSDPAVGADETCYPELTHLFGSYKRSKYVAEHEVLRAGAAGLDVTIVAPTFPLGPRDLAPTPSGQVILDFLNGRMPGYVDTVLNVVHVDDVGTGHVLALERGRRGRSYILGGENLSMKEILSELARITGLQAPALRVPGLVTLLGAALSEGIEGRLLRRRPHIPLEGARMATTHMAFDDRRARSELGYQPRPAALAIEESAHWFSDHGYVAPERQRRIVWQSS